MSYDLMVFDPKAAPKDPDAFMAWYGVVTQWGEGHSYDDAQVTTPALRAWYDAMREEWLPMNGPDSPFNDLALDSPLHDTNRATEYSIGRSAIYCCFSWSAATEAREAVWRLSGEHEVGFFDASADKSIIVFPKNAL